MGCRADDQVVTKISQMGGLPHFFGMGLCSCALDLALLLQPNKLFPSPVFVFITFFFPGGEYLDLVPK